MKVHKTKHIKISWKNFQKDTAKYRKMANDFITISVYDNKTRKATFGGGACILAEATLEELKSIPEKVLDFAKKHQEIYIVDKEGNRQFVLESI